jgi:hypothetical protein
MSHFAPGAIHVLGIAGKLVELQDAPVGRQVAVAVVDRQGVELQEELGHLLRLLQVSFVPGRAIEHRQTFDRREVVARVAVAVGAAGAIVGLATRVAKQAGRCNVEVPQPFSRRKCMSIVVFTRAGDQAHQQPGIAPEQAKRR